MIYEEDSKYQYYEMLFYKSITTKSKNLFDTIPKKYYPPVYYSIRNLVILCEFYDKTTNILYKIFFEKDEAIIIKILKKAFSDNDLNVVEFIINYTNEDNNILNNISLASLVKDYNININIIKCLVKNGINIHADGEDALISACFFGKFDIVKYLIDKGANFHIGNEYALENSIDNEHLNIADYLIKKGADINKYIENCLEHYLYYCVYGKVKILSYLACIYKENDNLDKNKLLKVLEKCDLENVFYNIMESI